MLKNSFFWALNFCLVGTGIYFIALLLLLTCSSRTANSRLVSCRFFPFIQVHTQCLPHFPDRCSLQPACRFSTVPPTLFNHAENDVLCISDPQGLSNGSRRYAPSGLSPLLVFANSKSGGKLLCYCNAKHIPVHSE